jgi:hypothetical protein
LDLIYWAAVQLPPAEGKEKETGIVWYQGKMEGRGKNKGYVAAVYLLLIPVALHDNELRLVIVDIFGVAFRTVKVADAQEVVDDDGKVFKCPLPKIAVHDLRVAWCTPSGHVGCCEEAERQHRR